MFTKRSHWRFIHSNRQTARLRIEQLECRATPTIISLAPSADNTLFEDANGNLSDGAGPHIFVGKTNQAAGLSIRRGLMKFDLSAIPSGSTINSATLTLKVTKVPLGAVAENIVVHLAQADWGEGTSDSSQGGTGAGEGDGIQATTGDATWKYTFWNTQTWTNLGGDFSSTASATTNVSGVGSYQWTGLAADVQQWLDTPANNFGWLLAGDESTNKTAKEIASRQNSNPSDRPTLQIDYTPPPPDLTITKTHTGNFKQGDPSDNYSIKVSNSGTGSTTGQVTVSDVLPIGLSPTADDNGTVNGWNISFVGQTITATRSDVLSSGATYPDLIVKVKVADDAPASVINTATVAGGGETNTGNDNSDDPTTIDPVADLTISKSHLGDFTQGESGDLYTITVNNISPGATTGTVTVTDALPTGLSPNADDVGTINGWTVNFIGQTITATRTDLLAGNASYPPLIVSVDVAPDAPSSVINTATVAGGGEFITNNDSANDATNIQPYNQPNQPPVNALPGSYSTNEDTAVALGGISVADVDSFNGAEKVTFSVNSGSITLNTSVTGGITAGEINGNGTGNVVVTARLAAINKTLADAAGLIFTPAQDQNGNVALTMTTDDQGHTGAGGPQSDADNSTVSVAAANDAPINTLPASGSTNADTPLALTGISIADVDAGSAVVSIVLNATHGELTLNTGIAAGISTSDVVGNGSSLVTVVSTLAKINVTLADANGLTFTPDAGFAGTATLTLVSNDLGNTGAGGPKADTDTESISVDRVVDHFTMDIPPSATGGVPITVNVTARNQAGAIVTNYGGSVNLSVTDTQAVMPTQATFVNGIATFDATLKTAGMQTITATDSVVSSISVQGSVLIAPASPARLVFNPQPGSVLVNAPFPATIRIEAIDAFGNLVTSDSGDVVTIRLQNNAVGAKLTGTATVKLENGQAAFPTLLISKPGPGFTLAASAPGLPLAFSNSFDVVPVARFNVTTTTTSITAGNAFNVTVQAVDAKGQMLSNYAGTVHFASNDLQAVLPADATLTNGQGTFSFTFKTSGSRKVSVNDLSKSSVAGTFKKPVQVTPANVVGLLVTGSQFALAGGKQSVTVAAIDAFGNVNPGYAGTVTLSSSDLAASLPGPHAFTPKDAGQHNFKVTFNTIGLQSLIAGDGSLNANLANIVVGTATPTVLTQPDPGNSATTALVVIGTSAVDVISVSPANAAGTDVTVSINGLPKGTFSPSGHVLVYGLGGNDSILVQSGTGPLSGVRVSGPIVIDAGAGKDIVDASGAVGDVIVVGGDGNDNITGSSGRDIVIGGRGADSLRGGAGDDILLSGLTSFDGNLTALFGLITEWSDSGTDFVTRIQHLTGSQPGGANGAFFLNALTVQKDTSLNQLFGGTENDWFLLNGGKKPDRIADLADGEFITEL